MRATLDACFKLSALLLAAACLSGAHARAQSAAAACPRVEVVCPSVFPSDTTDLFFSVKLDPSADPARLGYDWNVSAGTVVSGQGTPSIKVDAAGIQTSGTTVAVEVRGLTEGCPASASCTVPGRVGCVSPLDEYGNISFEDEQARLDNLAVELLNASEAKAHLICYGGRVARAGEARARCGRAKNYLATRRGIEPSRVVTVDGGYRENPTVTLWIVPRGADSPPASPTVDPSEVTFVKTRSARKRRR